MLEQILTHLHNWFEIDRRSGCFTIRTGSFTAADSDPLPDLAEGQFFRILGSVFNDGLHQWPADDLTDEVFTGTVCALAVPPAVQDLAEQVRLWQEQAGPVQPYQEESFGGYSYTAAADPVSGGPLTWQAVFRSLLNPWRKLA